MPTDSALARFFLFASIFIARTWAGTNIWTPVGPEGGEVSAWAVDPLHSGTVYAVRTGGIVHKSTDYGSHWQAIPQDFRGARSVAVDPADSNILYVGGLGLFKSIDAGATWTKTSLIDSASIFEIVLKPGRPDVVYAALYDRGIHKSTDSGATWLPVNTGLPAKPWITHLAICASAPDTLYAGSSESGIYFSSNGGASWESRVNGLPGGPTRNISVLTVDPADARIAYTSVRFNGLYKTVDSGAHWNPASADPQLSGLVSELIVHPEDSRVLFAADSYIQHRVSKSTTSGAAWSDLNTGLGEANILALAIDPQDPDVLYAGSQWTGAFITTTGGTAWNPINTGLYNQEVRDVYVPPLEPGTVYVTTAKTAVFRSTNRGTSWTSSSSGIPSNFVPLCLTGPPSFPKTLYVGGSSAGVYKSTDSAATWKAGRTGIETQSVNCLAVDPLAEETIYAGTQSSGVFKSIDSGVTWNPTGPGLPGAEILGLAVDPHRPGYVFALTDWNGIYRSANGGDSWTAIENLPHEGSRNGIVFDPMVPGRIFIRGNSEVYRSLDGGDTWVSESEGLTGTTGSPLTIDPRHTDTLYTAEYYGVFRTVDAGNQWSSFSDGIIRPSSVMDLATDGQPSPTLYAGTASNSAYAITLDYSNEFYLPQIADGTSGSVALLSDLVFVNTGDRNDVKVEFFDTMGEPMSLSMGELGMSSAFAFTLGRGEALTARTPGTGALEVGYAKVSTGPSVGGTAVFTYSDSGVVHYETGIPGTQPLTDFSLFMDSSGGTRETGLAMVNTGSENASAELRLYDTDFHVKAARTVATVLGHPFGGSEHLARYAPEIFPEINSTGLEQGVITVHSNRPLAAVTLRQNDNPALPFPRDISTMSTFPVIPGRADAAIFAEAGVMTAEPFYFPQVGDGRVGNVRFRTTLTLVNTSLADTATVEFFQSDGTPMTVNLGSLGTGHSFPVPLALGQAACLQTAGEGTLQVGYARVTATGKGVGGTAVFTYTDNGVTYFDAGVPSATPRKDFSLFMDASAGIYSTGLALVNTGSGPANVTLRLYDLDFKLIGTRSLASLAGVGVFDAGEHIARYAGEIFSEIASRGVELGVITVQSDQPLAAVTLRQRDQPEVGLPLDVYLLTTFPVVPGRADED